MGLKTTNYEVKAMKEVLPEAYAVIRSLKVEENGQGVAKIAIHRTRELALDANVKPFHEELIYFTSDRKVNDRETVYRKATTSVIEKRYNFETQKLEDVEVKPYFYGWDNDIQE